MNRIQHHDISRVVARHFKLDKTTDPIGSISSEIVPVMLMHDFQHPHPSDTEVNRAVYDGLQATVGGADIACVFELFNPVGSGVLAELCSVRAGCTYHTTISLHVCTAQNPHAGASGVGKFLHLGTQGSNLSGNSSLIDGLDLNRQAATNGGSGFISVLRVPADGFGELMCPGLPIFIMPGFGVRVQVAGLTAGTALWAASWIERRLPQLPGQ